MSNPPTLILDEFRATGRDVPDLGAALSESRWEPTRQPGRVYLDNLFIERRPEVGWPSGRPEAYYLTTDGQAEYLSDDLPRLEALLYEFAVSERYVDAPGL